MIGIQRYSGLVKQLNKPIVIRLVTCVTRGHKQSQFVTLTSRKFEDIDFHQNLSNGKHVRWGRCDLLKTNMCNVKQTNGLWISTINTKGSGLLTDKLSKNPFLSQTSIPIISWEQKQNFHKQNSDIHAKSATEHFIFSPQGVVNALPNYLQPYMRLMRFDRPIGKQVMILILIK